MGYEIYGEKPTEQEIAFAYRQRADALRASDRSYDAAKWADRSRDAAAWQKLLETALRDTAFAFNLATVAAHLTNDPRDEMTAGEMSLRIREIARWMAA